MSLDKGTRLGAYEILAPLGAGGMGEVYKARDTRLDRTVAIKLLPSHLSESDELRQRFEQEARAISSLNHPHICTLYDIGQEGDTDFLVMEYLEGETLAERLTKGPLSTAEVLRYATEIADALDKAHRQGIVHRDLKPANIMRTASGTKLLDFGLAKLKAPTEGAAGLTALPTQSAGLTVQGTILGTLQYMAPIYGTDRDIKPANLLVTKTGVVKILDFGLAKLKPPTEGPAGLTALPTQSTGLTVQGTILGTLRYA